MIEPPPKLTADEREKAVSYEGNADFKAVIANCNAHYFYWDKVKYNSAPFNPRVVWASLLFNRRLNTEPFHFGTYQFRVGITNAMQEILHHFDLQMGGIVPFSTVQNKEDKKYYLLSSLMEEAIASSQMEGASTTRKVAKEMLRKNESPKDTSQRMIVNNYNTVRYLSEHKDEPLTAESLRLVHQMITEKTLGNVGDESAFRTSDDIVVADGISGEIAHVPPKAGELPALIEELCAFFNSEHSSKSPTGFIHPVVKAVIIHFLVAWLHPFSDGNGRTARSLVYWFLLQKGYAFIEYLSISRVIYRSKSQYEKAFLYTERDDGDLGYFLHYNLNAMQKAADELRVYLERKSKERNAVSEYVTQGLSERQAKFIAYMKQNEGAVATVKEYEAVCGVSNQTARTDLYELVQKGAVREIPLNKRKVGFVL